MHDDDATRRGRHWTLEPTVTFLNHGSFGACPGVVLERQREWRDRMEREPVRFFVRDLEPLLDEALGVLGELLGGDAADLAFVPNPTAGVNAVLRSLEFAPGDELLVSDHEYNACRNTVDYVADRAGARVVVAQVPFPLRTDDEVLDAMLSRVTPRTRFALIDHVTSPTGLVLPAGRVAAALADKGVDVMIDGAHAPGMIPVDLRALGAAYYVGTCHKWLCAPKGASFLHVRRDRQAAVRPAIISHGANSPRRDRSRFRLEFDWTGTIDPSAYLCVPDAIRFVGSLLPGGWPDVMRTNRALALRGREILCAALGVAPPAPESMIGSLATVALPDATSAPTETALYADALQTTLYERHRIEVPIVPWPAHPRRLVRISAQLYNSPADYEKLARALRASLSAGEGAPSAPA